MMGISYAKLIRELLKRGKLHQPTYDQLVKAPPSATKSLAHYLLNHRNPDIRHYCAHIPGDRGLARAIPSLMEALRDTEEYVRQDALWSIERLSGFEPGKLQYLLQITSIDEAKELHLAIQKW